MKLMRKLSLLMAILLCVTVGGVYATWIYIKDGTDIADQHEHLTITLAKAEFSNESYGKYDVDYSNLVITIDQKAENDHTAVLNITGSVFITFTPSKSAPVDVKSNGVETFIHLDTSKAQAEWTYNGKQIFTVDTSVITLGCASGQSWGTPDSLTGTFTYEITTDMLKDAIKLGDFVLDTKGKHDQFSAALTQAQIGVIVSDGQTTSNP